MIGKTDNSVSAEKNITEDLNERYHKTSNGWYVVPFLIFVASVAIIACSSAQLDIHEIKKISYLNSTEFVKILVTDLYGGSAAIGAICLVKHIKRKQNEQRAAADQTNTVTLLEEGGAKRTNIHIEESGRPRSASAIREDAHEIIQGIKSNFVVKGGYLYLQKDDKPTNLPEDIFDLIETEILRVETNKNTFDLSEFFNKNAVEVSGSKKIKLSIQKINERYEVYTIEFMKKDGVTEIYSLTNLTDGRKDEIIKLDLTTRNISREIIT